MQSPENFNSLLNSESKAEPNTDLNTDLKTELNTALNTDLNPERSPEHIDNALAVEDLHGEFDENGERITHRATDPRDDEPSFENAPEDDLHTNHQDDSDSRGNDPELETPLLENVQSDEPDEGQSDGDGDGYPLKEDDDESDEEDQIDDHDYDYKTAGWTVGDLIAALSKDTSQHGLQCAYHLQQQFPEDVELQVAGLLHDIAHGITSEARHGMVCADLVRPIFGERVADLVALHVDAKRYLVTVDPSYRELLSPESIHTLALQGSTMNQAEQMAFTSQRHFEDAISLRRADDAAKVAGFVVPGLDAWELPMRTQTRCIAKRAYRRGWLKDSRKVFTSASAVRDQE